MRVQYQVNESLQLTSRLSVEREELLWSQTVIWNSFCNSFHLNLQIYFRLNSEIGKLTFPKSLVSIERARKRETRRAVKREKEKVHVTLIPSTLMAEIHCFINYQVNWLCSSFKLHLNYILNTVTVEVTFKKPYLPSSIRHKNNCKDFTTQGALSPASVQFNCNCNCKVTSVKFGHFICQSKKKKNHS